MNIIHRVLFMKLGTGSVTLPNGGFNLQDMGKIGSWARILKSHGIMVVLITSGAVGIGSRWLTFDREDKIDEILAKRAQAALGQGELIPHWTKALNVGAMDSDPKMHAAQLLFDNSNLKGRKKEKTRAVEVLELLMSMPNVIPVLNENDPMADDELLSGDNDVLTRLVSEAVSKPYKPTNVVFFTNKPGVMHPETGELITLITPKDTKILDAIKASNGHKISNGGMDMKLRQAFAIRKKGARVAIAHFQNPDAIPAFMDGKDFEGTLIEV